MKIKNFLFNLLVVLTVVSCSKNDNLVPKAPQNVEIQSAIAPPNVSNGLQRKAYVFIEPCSKNMIISSYLKAQNPATLGFTGFSNGVMMTLSNKIHFINYMDMPFWNNGVLPPVQSVDIPEVTGGVDSFALRTYTPQVNKFKKIRLTKTLANENAWVTFVVPLIYASNTTQISYCAVKNNKIVSSGNGLPTTFNCNTQIASYVFDYQGNTIPQGMYRVYTTYVNSAMRVPLNLFDYVEFRSL